MWSGMHKAPEDMLCWLGGWVGLVLAVSQGVRGALDRRFVSRRRDCPAIPLSRKDSILGREARGAHFVD